MQSRPLGRSGLLVPSLCLGGNVFGWTADEATSFAILDAAYDAGLRFIDTADVYSRWVPGHAGGESEVILGRWMKARGNRDRIILATKVGKDMGDGKVGLARGYIPQALEASLRRLQTDRIDLYQSHDDDTSVPPEEPLEAFAKLIADGKVRAIGASNFTAERLALSLDTAARLGLPRYECLQPEYNLYMRRGYEEALEQVCLSHGLGVIPWYGLAAGFLTGKYRTKADTEGAARGARVAGYMTPRGFRVLEALDAVAARHGAKPAHVALAWLMARPSVTAPIASATSVAQVEDLAAATRLTLGPQDLADLDIGDGADA